MRSATAFLLTASLGLAAAAEPGVIVVGNPLDGPRPAEVVAIPWKDAVARAPGLAVETLVVNVLPGGTPVPSQVLDRDGDGTPDEVLFLAQVPAKGTVSYRLDRRSGPAPAAEPSRLFARFVPERKDDFAWENDRMAHRTYGPGVAKEGTRGGIDVWSKRTRSLVIDRWYKHGNYHDDAGEGCDCYHVGPTLGCGGLGYLDAQGGFTTAPTFATHRLIASGPLRLAFTVTYPAVALGKASIVETRTIQMDLGSPVFRCTSSWQVTGDATGIVPQAGLRAEKSATLPPGTGNVATTWVDPEGGVEKNGRIGVALILPPGRTARVAQGHVLGPVGDDLSGSVAWHAGATWSKGLDAQTPEAWSAEIAGVAARLAAPLTWE